MSIAHSLTDLIGNTPLLSLEQATPITLELIEYSKAVVKRIHGGKSKQKQEKAEKREKRE